MTGTCIKDTEEVEDWWPVEAPYSPLACNLLRESQGMPCTMIEFYGIQLSNSFHPNNRLIYTLTKCIVLLESPKPTCTPKSIREITAAMFNYPDEVINLRKANRMKCKELCSHNYTTFTTSTEALNVEELMDQMRGTDNDDKDRM